MGNILNSIRTHSQVDAILATINCIAVIPSSVMLVRYMDQFGQNGAWWPYTVAIISITLYAGFAVIWLQGSKGWMW